jgi:hypothetical protein
MRTRPFCPDAERETCLVLDDFGSKRGCAWLETDAESADRATLIRDLLDVEDDDGPMSDSTRRCALSAAILCSGVDYRARTTSARQRRPCSTRRAPYGHVGEAQLADDKQKKTPAAR